MKIPDKTFRLFMGGGGRIVGVSPLPGESNEGFQINHIEGKNKVMVIAVLEKRCTMVEWHEIIALAGTWANASEMVTTKFGGISWLGIEQIRGDIQDVETILPFISGVIAEA